MCRKLSYTKTINCTKPDSNYNFYYTKLVITLVGKSTTYLLYMFAPIFHFLKGKTILRNEVINIEVEASP